MCSIILTRFVGFSVVSDQILSVYLFLLLHSPLMIRKINCSYIYFYIFLIHSCFYIDCFPQSKKNKSIFISLWLLVSCYSFLYARLHCAGWAPPPTYKAQLHVDPHLWINNLNSDPTLLIRVIDVCKRCRARTCHWPHSHLLLIICINLITFLWKQKFNMKGEGKACRFVSSRNEASVCRQVSLNSSSCITFSFLNVIPSQFSVSAITLLIDSLTVAQLHNLFLPLALWFLWVYSPSLAAH